MCHQAEAIDEHPSWQSGANDAEAEDEQERWPPECEHMVDEFRLGVRNLAEDFSSERCTIEKLLISPVAEILDAPEGD